ncbi:MAG: uroporphyrinogen-III synthase [Gallionellaceae bacterium]|nr:uroporphyrinogen-III synthase [Gallionellaceae bacterium]
MSPDLPLAHLHIAVTRPRDQAVSLSQRIEQAGGEAILFPLLEIAPAENPQILNVLLARLAEFDYAVFISPNAARYGIAAIQAHGGLPAHLKIISVGQGSTQALRELGITRVITPENGFDSEAMLALPELSDVAGKKILIFRGDGGRALLSATLRERGAQVEFAECYRRLPPPQPVSMLLAAKPDAITVTSSEAVRYLSGLLDAPARLELTALPLFALHPRIAAEATQLGWRDVITTASGDDGLLSGLVAWAQKRKRLP